MAQATVTLKVYPFLNGVETSQRRTTISGQAAIQASPWWKTPTTGGLGTATTGALNWQALVDQLTGAAVIVETTASQPIMVYFTSVGGSGYIYGWNKSTNKFQIFTGAAAQAALTELTNGAAIPAGVSGDVIEFDADFAKSL